MTLTGIAADLRGANRRVALGRRLLAIGAMFAGAELVLHGQTTVALAIAVGLLASVTLGALVAAKRPGEWRTASTGPA
jgi:hypothetical protein